MDCIQVLLLDLFLNLIMFKKRNEDEIESGSLSGCLSNYVIKNRNMELAARPTCSKWAKEPGGLRRGPLQL